MSHEDAAENSARAARLRTFVHANKLAGHNPKSVVVTVGSINGEDLQTELVLDDVLSAANALDAQGVQGWAAARLACKEIWGEAGLDYADVALEAADTADDTLTKLRASMGSDVVDDEIAEFREQD